MNKYLLRAKMSQKGIKTLQMVECLNMTSTTFSRKINGKAEFTQGEIHVMKEKLDLTADDVDSIFFTV